MLTFLEWFSKKIVNLDFTDEKSIINAQGSIMIFIIINNFPFKKFCKLLIDRPTFEKK